MVTNASFEILLIFFKQWALKKERSALVSMLGGRQIQDEVGSAGGRHSHHSPRLRYDRTEVHLWQQGEDHPGETVV